MTPIRAYNKKEWKQRVRKGGKEDFCKWFIEWDFIKKGLDSGFHPCCVAHFKMRLLFMSLHEWAFGTLGIFDPNKDVRSWTSDQEEEMNKYLTSTKYMLAHPGYVSCWFHTTLRYATRRPYEWYKCRKCKWAQIRFKKCRRCS